MEDVRTFTGSIGTRAMHADLPEEDAEKYWIRVTASNAELDEHNSIMDPDTTLKNFEMDAKSRLGVALTDHHAFRSFGYGRSNDARLTDKNELFIDFFIVKDMKYPGGRREFETSEELIRAIETGLVNQVSVEFYKAREICNLCQMPIRRYSWYDDWNSDGRENCSHKMGKMYPVEGGKKKEAKATYTVYDARLKAVSLVEFGSNRNTAIEKKRELAEALEQVFSETPGPALAGVFADGIRKKVEADLMENKDWITGLREALGIEAIKSTDSPETVIAAIETSVSELRSEVETQKTKIARFEASAADGKAYHAARIEEAIAEGKRAHGDVFDEGYHREYYADLPKDKLDAAIENNRKIADAAVEKPEALLDGGEGGGDGGGNAEAQAHRQARVDEAIKQGTRAYGAVFDEAYHREYYAELPLEKLEAHITHNKQIGDKVLPVGRSTTDTHEPPPERSKVNARRRQLRNRRR